MTQNNDRLLRILLLLMALFILTAFTPLGVRYLGGFHARSEDSYVSNGYDIYWYSGNQSGQTARIEGATGDIDTEGDLTVADIVTIQSQTAISATDAGVITPTGTFQLLESAAEVTPTLATGGMVTGQYLILVNTANTTINIADSGTAKLGGAAALAQYDSLELIFDGTNWVEVGRSNN